MPPFSGPSAIRQRMPQFSPVVLRIFLGAAVLFAAHRVLIAACPAYSHALVRGYLGDFLALPICVPFFATSQTWLGVRRVGANLRATEILAYWLLFSVWFEILAPQVWHRLTADPWDVVAYGLGGLCLWLLSR